VGLAVAALATGPARAQVPAEPAPAAATPAEPAPAPVAPDPRPAAAPDRIEAAWFAPADSLEARVGHTRRTALERGI
jgi:hypothetical protein